MAWWLTVYCRGDVETLSAGVLDLGIRGRDPEARAGVDYSTLAEDYDVDVSLVRPGLDALRVTDDLSIHYGADRPVVVHVWTERARIEEELEEAREGRDPPPAAEPWLESCTGIVAIELGFSMLDDFGVVLAYEVARFVCQKLDGVLVDDDGVWQRVDDGAFVQCGR